MNSRTLIAMGLLLVSLLIYVQWQQDHNPAFIAEQQAKQSSQAVKNLDNSDNSLRQDGLGREIVIQSDLLRLTINTYGGDVVKSELLTINAKLNDNKAFTLLENNSDHLFIAQSGLVGRDGSDSLRSRANYSVEGDTFTLDDKSDSISVPLVFNKDGVTFTKTYTLMRGSYNVAVDFTIDNATDRTLEVQPYGQLKRTADDKSGSFIMPTYMGGAYSSVDENYKKYSFSDIASKNLSVDTTSGWVAMLQHYFVVAWIPDQHRENHLYTRANRDQSASIGYQGELLTIAPHSQSSISSHLWTGPKNQQEMQMVAKNFDLTVDYGWAWFIAKPLFILLTFIQSLVGNWGLAIIGVTLVVKSLLYPLTKAQYTSMAKMRMLQPKLQELRDRYGDDRQRMGQETMKLYRENKVNPMGGCLPVFIQMPIFIALYWMFLEAVELRHAPFALWINDLSAQDPYYILPLIMGATMFLMQKLSPTPTTDPLQQKIIMAMPIAFTFLFLTFPSGLVLYWITNNTLTIIQQWWIYRVLEKKGLGRK